MFANNKEEKVSKTKDGLANQRGHFTDGSGESTHHFSSDVQEAAAVAGADMGSFVHRTSHYIHELVDSATQSVSGMEEATTLRIRKNPVRSSLIALGLGLFVGMISRRWSFK